MSEDDGFEWVTNPSQFAPPPPLRRKRIEHPAIRHTNGKMARFYVCELSQYEYGQYQQELWVLNPDGTRRFQNDHSDLRLLPWCCRDANNNRLWPTTDAGIHQLGRYGKSVIDALVAAVNEVHGDEAPKDEDSATTPTGSSPSTSPGTSDSTTSTGS